MITGSVIGLHALLKITFHLQDDSISEREFVIDTGFTGFLTLPSQDISDLGLPFRHYTAAYLADGSEVQISVYDAVVVWNGAGIEVRVLGTGQRPLLGTALLKDHSLFAQFADFGLVELEEL